jgi:DNA-binding protein Fis
MLGRIELEMIDRALAETKGNHLRSSHILGLNRSTLKKRLQAPGAPASKGA